MASQTLRPSRSVSVPQSMPLQKSSRNPGQGAGPVISFKCAESAQVISVVARGLTTTSCVQDTPLKDEIIAMNSEGNVQRGKIHTCLLT